MRQLDLTGRTAIVTGASRGIGLATARSLATAGANVVLTARTQESADAAATSLGARTVGFAAHAADEPAAHACVKYTVERFGSLDILVNNAGTNPAYGSVIDQDHSRFAKTFDVNLWAPVLWSSLVAKAWMNDHAGVIVNIASVGGLSVEANIGLYNATKAALIHLTKQLAWELSPAVRVNAVAPGVVRTRLAEALWRDHEQELAAALPSGGLVNQPISVRLWHFWCQMPRNGLPGRPW